MQALWPGNIDERRCRGIMEDMTKLLPLLEPSSTVACCAPLASAPLSDQDAHALAVQLKAIADPARLRLLSLMMANPDFEACTCDLTDALGLSQPTVSHHLKKLTDAGIVFPHRREGSWTYYRVVPETLISLAGVISPSVSVS